MASSKYDPQFTKNVIDNIGPKADARTRQVFSSLIQHIHDFAREVDLTVEEWERGMKFLNETGHIYFTSNKLRNEMLRLSDVLGLESVVNEIAYYNFSEEGQTPTSSAILGPFWSPNAPFRNNGESIIQSPHQGTVCKMHGKIMNAHTGQALSNAVIDIWQASSNGKYDFQDPDNQSPNNLRGKFRTDSEGRYWFYLLKPTAYSLPRDGPSFELIQLLDRHTMRPAHIHTIITADNHKSLVTQLFPDDDPWLKSDTVFAVKSDLICHFAPLKGDPQATTQLEYDFRLTPEQANGHTT